MKPMTPTVVTASDVASTMALMQSTQAQVLLIDDSLIAFYERVCPANLQKVVSAVRLGASPREVIASTGENPLVIDWLFKDMLVKGVIRFSEMAPA